jgi:hypothetical protein
MPMLANDEGHMDAGELRSRRALGRSASIHSGRSAAPWLPDTIPMSTGSPSSARNTPHPRMGITRAAGHSP